MIKKISYERRVYESVDDNSLSKAISQKKKKNEKNKSCNKGKYKAFSATLNVVNDEGIKYHAVLL